MILNCKPMYCYCKYVNETKNYYYVPTYNITVSINNQYKE